MAEMGTELGRIIQTLTLNHTELLISEWRKVPGDMFLGIGTEVPFAKTNEAEEHENPIPRVQRE